MLKIWFLAFALLALQATDDKAEIMACKENEFDSATQVCMTGYDNLGSEPEVENLTMYYAEHDIYSSCKDSSKFCNVSITIDEQFNMVYHGICTPKIANDQICSRDSQCSNVHCIHQNRTSGICKSSALSVGEACFYDADCSVELSCSKSQKKCAARVQANADCSDVKCSAGSLCNSSNICQELYALPDNSTTTYAYYCQSGYMSDSKKCLPLSDIPILQIPDGKQYLNCSTDNDCVYQFANKTIAEVGIKRCYYASWAEASQKYCRYGGGEDKLIKSMKSLIAQAKKGNNEMDLYAYQRLANPVERIDFIQPSSCALDKHIKDEYGSALTLSISVLLMITVILI